MPALRNELACILCQVEGELNAEAVTCARVPCLPSLSLCWS
jgi:hypothetical protein